MSGRGRPKGSHDVMPEIRGGLKRFFIGKPVSEVWQEIYDNSPSDFMRLAISAMPKEVQAEVTTYTIEDFVVTTATSQALDDSSTEETHVH
jgi:hypothetical protein